MARSSSPSTLDIGNFIIAERKKKKTTSARIMTTTTTTWRRGGKAKDGMATVVSTMRTAAINNEQNSNESRAKRTMVRTDATAGGASFGFNASAAAAAEGGGSTKLWSGNPEDVSILAVLRCLAFTIWTFSLAVPLFITMLLIFPFCYMFDRTRRYALSFVNDLWAICSTTPFVKITVEGREHLPKQDEPAVYVANHASFMDIFSLFHLKRPFKFISKTSNFIIPIIGWSMFLTGHVPLKRTDRRSQMETLKICRETLQKNGSVLFFPEGTRSVDGTMADFKKGAFSVAAKEKVPVVPITLVNTGGVMRNGKEWMLRAGEIKVIVHPRIAPSEDADALCDKSEKVIKEALVNNS